MEHASRLRSVGFFRSAGRFLAGLGLAALLALCAGPARAQVQVGFSPSSLDLAIGEHALVAIETSGGTMAAFQLDLGFGPVFIDVLNPNEAYRGTVSPFAPLGANPLCTAVRGTPTCDDPPWLLTSTGRSPVGTDVIDNPGGFVRVAYGTHGATAPPGSGGAIALVEVVGVWDGTTTVSLSNVILADNQEPPVSQAVSLGSLTVVVGTGIANLPPVLSPIGNQSVWEGLTLHVPISSSDPDGDGLDLTALGLPAFCVLTDGGNGSGSIDCSPAIGNAGVYPVTVRVTDDGGPNLADEETLNITVLATQCADADGDGYGAPGHESCRRGTLTDCDDANPAVHPSAVELCRNTLDDDCDGAADGAVPSCQSPVCVVIALGAPGTDPSITTRRTSACPTPGVLPRAVDMIWGNEADLRLEGGQVRLGAVHSVACADTDDVQLFDSLRPDASKADFVLVRETTQGNYGVSGDGEPRVPDSGGCP